MQTGFERRIWMGRPGLTSWQAVLDERWAELLPDEERAARSGGSSKVGSDDARRAESGDGAPEAVSPRTSIRRRRFETFDDQAPCLFALDATRENLAAADGSRQV